jgi:hypothetical protein
VLKYEVKITPIYDRELTGLNRQARERYVQDRIQPNSVVYWYVGGQLVPDP